MRNSPASIAGVPHWIYRLFAADDTLLYIGCTARPQERPYARTGRPWYSEVARVALEGPYEGLAAFEIEQALILDYLPIHNRRLDNGSSVRRLFVEHDAMGDSAWTPEGEAVFVSRYFAAMDDMRLKVAVAEKRRVAMGRASTAWRAKSRGLLTEATA